MKSVGLYDGHIGYYTVLKIFLHNYRLFCFIFWGFLSLGHLHAPVKEEKEKKDFYLLYTYIHI